MSAAVSRSNKINGQIGVNKRESERGRELLRWSYVRFQSNSDSVTSDTQHKIVTYRTLKYYLYNTSVLVDVPSRRQVNGQHVNYVAKRNLIYFMEQNAEGETGL